MKKRFYLPGLMALLLVLTGTTSHAQASVKTDTVVAVTAEKPASFPGGVEGWRRYLMSNLQYPKKALKKNIQGEVKVQMVVDAKGNLSDIKALNDPGGGLAAEAERVLRDGPKWIPAEQKGKKVTYRFVQSITFQLE